MQLIVGLGNYGSKYDLTKHNYGFAVIDEIAKKYNFPNFASKYDGLVSKAIIANHDCILFKPATYMNNSGQAIAKIMKYYKMHNDNLLILHDDIDFDLGKIKVKFAGGNGGHNGIKSIDKIIGANYKRLRLGIGRPSNINIDVADYVLQKFNIDELAIVNKSIFKIVKLFDYIILKEDDKMLNNFYIR